MVQRVCFVLVGILLGAIVTPETLKGMATWPLSIAVLAVATICMIAATTSYLRFVHGWDWASAFLGASPGAMAQVVALSAEFKADLRGVAIVQVMRVLLIMIGLPGSLALAGLVGRRRVRRAGARRRLVAGRAGGAGRRLDRAGAVAALDEIPRRAVCSARWRAPPSCTAPAGCMRCCRGGSAAAR